MSRHSISPSIHFFAFSQMRQWDIQQQAFKTSRLIRHQEYGTFNSHRGNISGRPSPSNSTPTTVHHVTERRMIQIFL